MKRLTVPVRGKNGFFAWLYSNTGMNLKIVYLSIPPLSALLFLFLLSVWIFYSASFLCYFYLERYSGKCIFRCVICLQNCLLLLKIPCIRIRWLKNFLSYNHVLFNTKIRTWQINLNNIYNQVIKLLFLFLRSGSEFFFWRSRSGIFLKVRIGSGPGSDQYERR